MAHPRHLLYGWGGAGLCDFVFLPPPGGVIILCFCSAALCRIVVHYCTVPVRYIIIAAGFPHYRYYTTTSIVRHGRCETNFYFYFYLRKKGNKDDDDARMVLFLF